MQIDKHRAKSALKEIGIAKVSEHLPWTFNSIPYAFFQFVVPSMALAVVDRAMQAFGAEGLSQDQDLAAIWAGLRTLRIADVSLSAVSYADGSLTFL